MSWERRSLWQKAAAPGRSSVRGWMEAEAFHRGTLLPPCTALGKGKCMCTNHWWPEQTKIPGVLSDYSYTSFPWQKRNPEAHGQIPPKKQSCPLHHVPRHSCLQDTELAKAAKLLPQLQQRGVCREAASLITFGRGLDAKRSHKQTAQKESARSSWDLRCLASWFLPLSHSRRPTWVCMATNYVGHLPSCTDLDNTAGYILSEINCS